MSYCERSVEAFRLNAPFSAHNYQLLVRTQGEEAAQEYQVFCQLFAEELEAHRAKLIAKETISYREMHEFNLLHYDELVGSTQHLSNHPGYKVLKSTLGQGKTPVEIPAAMQQFCQELVRLIQRAAAPAHIAAYCLELSKIHGFVEAMGRVSRILMNCCLMSYGIKPLLFTDLETKQKYYQAIEASAEHPHAILEFISSCIANNSVTLDADDDSENISFAIHDPKTNYLLLDFGYEQVRLPYANFDAYWEFRARCGLQHGVPLSTSASRSIQVRLQQLRAESFNCNSYFRMASALMPKQPRVAIFYFNQAVNSALVTLTKDKDKFIGECYANMGMCAVSTENFDTAYIYFCRAHQILRETNNTNLPAFTLAETWVQKLAFLNEYHGLSSPEMAANLVRPEPEPELPIVAARKAQESGDFKKAVATYNKALKTDGQNPELWFGKGSGELNSKTLIRHENLSRKHSLYVPNICPLYKVLRFCI